MQSNKKAQNEELAEMLGAKIDESQKTLLWALPELVEKVVLGALEGKVIAGTDLKTLLQTVNVAGTTQKVESDRASAVIKADTAVIDATENIGILPQVSEELPDDALDYFSEL